MAMADDIFGHIGWLHFLGLLETIKIIGSGCGLISLSVDGILVFDRNEKIGRGEK